MWENFVSTFYLNFIEKDRWKYLAVGLQNTLTITFFACLVGIVLGFLVALVRSTHERTGKLLALPDGNSGNSGSAAAADYLFCCIWQRAY